MNAAWALASLLLRFHWPDLSVRSLGTLCFLGLWEIPFVHSFWAGFAEGQLSTLRTTSVVDLFVRWVWKRRTSAVASPRPGPAPLAVSVDTLRWRKVVIPCWDRTRTAHVTGDRTSSASL